MKPFFDVLPGVTPTLSVSQPDSPKRNRNSVPRNSQRGCPQVTVAVEGSALSSGTLGAQTRGGSTDLPWEGRPARPLPPSPPPITTCPQVPTVSYCNPVFEPFLPLLYTINKLYAVFDLIVKAHV